MTEFKQFEDRKTSAYPATMGPDIRPYRTGCEADREALVEVCLRTGDNGADAGPLHADRALLATVYALPYAALDPSLCFLAEDAEGICGYIVGTSDSTAFEDRCERDWWPALRMRHPLPAADDASADAHLVRRLHVPPRAPVWLTATAPAHLHINLLPRAQGQGAGRRLMARLLRALHAQGVPGVHVDVSARNPEALAFYRRMGFRTELATPDGALLARATQVQDLDFVGGNA